MTQHSPDLLKLLRALSMLLVCGACTKGLEEPVEPLPVAVKAPSGANSEEFYFEQLPNPSSIKSLTLFSLSPQMVMKNGSVVKSGEADPKEGSFHGWKIIGSKTLKGREAFSRVVNSVNKSLDHPPDDDYMCFEPRHGIRVKDRKNRLVDLVICFECYSVEIYQPSGRSKHKLGRQSAKVLNAMLR